MKTLITGGAGFIGSHLAQKLLNAGDTVHIIDDLSTGSLDNITDILSDQCTFVQSTVLDTLTSDDHWIADYDRIFHLAAAVGVQLIVDEPVRSIENNVLESAALLKAAARDHVPILVTSSSEVYGKSDRVPFSEDDDVTYGATIYSRWSYAASKAIDEYLALAYHQQQKLPTVIVRLFNTVGPRQSGKYGMVVPRFIERAIANRPIEIYGDGQQTRCFSHVSDVTDALIRLLSTKSCYGRVFNVGSDEEVTICALAERIIEMTNSQSTLTFIPYDEAYGTSFDDLQRRVPDLSRIRDAIDFKRTRNLNDILQELITLYQSS